MKTLVIAAILLVHTVSAMAQASVTLAWDPITGPGFAGYNLYQGGASRTYTNMLNVGTSPSVTVSNLAPGRTYYFAVTDYDIIGLESDYSAELLYNAPVPLPAIPVITQQPVGSTNAAGSSVSLSVQATGPAGFPISYQWLKNSTNISGATSSILALSNLSWADFATYQCRVSDSGGSLLSSSVTVAVRPPVPANLRVTGP